MAVQTYLNQQPESPLLERWLWPSDVIMTDDGSEQTISLTPSPRRSWSGNFVFDNEIDIRRHVATMFAKFKGIFDWPAWQWVVKLKQPAAIAATTIYCNTARGDFRVDGKAYITEGNNRELLVVSAVHADRIVTTTGLVAAYSARALICPVVTVYSADNSAVTRRPTNKSMTSSFTFIEYSAPSPFILDADKVTLDTFNSLPVLNKRAIGAEFAATLITGLEIIDYGAQVDLRSRWANAQFRFTQTYQSQMVLSPADWKWWRTFADYCRGSTNPFYVPTWRTDLVPYLTPAAGATTMQLIDTVYGDHYYPVTSFRRIMFLRPDGVQHFATITNRTTASARDQITFTPALPAGDWTDVEVSLLLLARIGDDVLTIEHAGFQSSITINMRTTDG